MTDGTLVFQRPQISLMAEVKEVTTKEDEKVFRCELTVFGIDYASTVIAKGSGSGYQARYKKIKKGDIVRIFGRMTFGVDSESQMPMLFEIDIQDMEKIGKGEKPIDNTGLKEKVEQMNNEELGDMWMELEWEAGINIGGYAISLYERFEIVNTEVTRRRLQDEAVDEFTSDED